MRRALEPRSCRPDQTGRRPGWMEQKYDVMDWFQMCRGVLLCTRQCRCITCRVHLEVMRSRRIRGEQRFAISPSAVCATRAERAFPTKLRCGQGCELRHWPKRHLFARTRALGHPLGHCYDSCQHRGALPEGAERWPVGSKSGASARESRQPAVSPLRVRGHAIPPHRHGCDVCRASMHDVVQPC